MAYYNIFKPYRPSKPPVLTPTNIGLVFQYIYMASERNSFKNYLEKNFNFNSFANLEIRKHATSSSLFAKVFFCKGTYKSNLLN